MQYSSTAFEKLTTTVYHEVGHLCLRAQAGFEIKGVEIFVPAGLPDEIAGRVDGTGGQPHPLQHDEELSISVPLGGLAATLILNDNGKINQCFDSDLDVANFFFYGLASDINLYKTVLRALGRKIPSKYEELMEFTIDSRNISAPRLEKIWNTSVVPISESIIKEIYGSVFGINFSSIFVNESIFYKYIPDKI